MGVGQARWCYRFERFSLVDFNSSRKPKVEQKALFSAQMKLQVRMIFRDRDDWAVHQFNSPIFWSTQPCFWDERSNCLAFPSQFVTVPAGPGRRHPRRPLTEQLRRWCTRLALREEAGDDHWTHLDSFGTTGDRCFEGGLGRQK